MSRGIAYIIILGNPKDLPGSLNVKDKRLLVYKPITSKEVKLTYLNSTRERVHNVCITEQLNAKSVLRAAHTPQARQSQQKDNVCNTQKSTWERQTDVQTVLSVPSMVGYKLLEHEILGATDGPYNLDDILSIYNEPLHITSYRPPSTSFTLPTKFYKWALSADLSNPRMWANLPKMQAWAQGGTRKGFPPVRIEPALPQTQCIK
ncbi:hypothetical protein C8Q74DRAFT_1215433 [Fomes fomentarius]|nr:hypothetical protein C8Q74DRAFT_1215433 [Fomes fomentarius]